MSKKHFNFFLLKYSSHLLDKLLDLFHQTSPKKKKTPPGLLQSTTGSAEETTKGAHTHDQSGCHQPGTTKTAKNNQNKTCCFTQIIIGFLLTKLLYFSKIVCTFFLVVEMTEISDTVFMPTLDSDPNSSKMVAKSRSIFVGTTQW